MSRRCSLLVGSAMAVLLLSASTASSDETNLTMQARFGDGVTVATISAQRVRVRAGGREDVIALSSGSVDTLDHNERTFKRALLSESGKRFVGLRTTDDVTAASSPMGRAPRFTVARGASGLVRGYAADEYIVSMMTTARRGEIVGTSPETPDERTRPLARFHVWMAPGLGSSAALRHATQLTLIASGPAGKRIARALVELKDVRGMPVLVTTETRSMDDEMTTIETVEFSPTSNATATFVPPADYRRIP